MESACRFSSAKVVEIVKCFLNIVSKIRQIFIISARFCGWKCALVAQIDMKSQSEFLNEFLLLWLMLIFLSVYTEIKTKHWTCCVTKCTFLTPKYNECDYLSKLLSQLEHFMIELPDDFNNFSTTKPARWLEYIGTSIFVCNTVQFQLLLKLEYFWLSEDWIISTGRLKIQVLIFSWK